MPITMRIRSQCAVYCQCDYAHFTTGQTNKGQTAPVSHHARRSRIRPRSCRHMRRTVHQHRSFQGEVVCERSAADGTKGKEQQAADCMSGKECVLPWAPRGMALRPTPQWYCLFGPPLHATFEVRWFRAHSTVISGASHLPWMPEKIE